MERKGKENQSTVEGGQAWCHVVRDLSHCFVRTQLLRAGQEVLLVGQNVIEDEELRGDGVACTSSSAAIPLHTNRKKERGDTLSQGQAVQDSTSLGDDFLHVIF